MIVRNSEEKVYDQVKKDLLLKINNNIYKVGDKLPTNMQLCDLFGVSRITINRALMDLESEGYIEKKQGKGCYVKFKEINQNISNFYSFTDELIKMGYVPSSIFISLTLEDPNSEAKSALNLSDGEKVYVLKRLRLADDLIVAYDRSIIPEKIIPNFDKKMLVEGSLYKALEKFYGFRPNSSEETIEAISINPDDAEKMKMKPLSPVLRIKRVSYYHDTKVEFNDRLVNSKLFKYRMKLK